MDYKEFIENKIDIAPLSGIEIDVKEVSPILKPHQRDAVLWALKGGRRGIFARFGLGKTVMQLEWCRLLQKHEGGKALIVMPLNVMPEFKQDAQNLLHMDVPPYVRTMAEVEASYAPILLTNYERVRDGDIDPHYFTAVSLDEAATLRSFGSKIYQTFMDKFHGVRYKLTNTATPSPNRYKELIHYAGFLEVMDTGQALTRFSKGIALRRTISHCIPAVNASFGFGVRAGACFYKSHLISDTAMKAMTSPRWMFSISNYNTRTVKRRMTKTDK